MRIYQNQIAIQYGIYLKTYRNPDEAVNFIKENGIKISYQYGRKRIDKILKISRILYNMVKKNMLNIPNEIYKDTIIGGIQGFFRIYDPDYEAHSIKITADYPLYNNLINKLEGVEFIKEYINSIYLENLFCSFFSEEKINRLLNNYSSDYKELVINIFEIVLYEVLACMLLENNVRELIISEDELNEIYFILKDKNRIEVKSKMLCVYEKIRKDLINEHKDLQEYIEKNLDSIIEIIIINLNQNTLDKVFITG